jgi:hypothetical protein
MSADAVRVSSSRAASNGIGATPQPQRHPKQFNCARVEIDLFVETAGVVSCFYISMDVES